MWQLHLQEGSISFSSLTELAKSIPTESKQKFRLAPSEYGRSHTKQLARSYYANYYYFYLQINHHYYYYVCHHSN